MSFDENKYYLGKLCKRGHDYEGTGQSLRGLRGKKCMECERERGRKWYAENSEKVRERGRKWRAENSEKVREYAEKRYYSPKEVELRRLAKTIRTPVSEVRELLGRVQNLSGLMPFFRGKDLRNKSVDKVQLKC